MDLRAKAPLVTLHISPFKIYVICCFIFSCFCNVL